MPGQGSQVALLHGRIQLVSRHRRHHHQGRGVGVEFKQRADGSQQGIDRDAVGPQYPPAELVGREVGIGKDQLVAVAHLGHHLEQVWADEG